jgi:uncharacterized protein (TIGR02145 family)
MKNIFRISVLLIIILSVFILNSCEKDKPTIPVLTTIAVSGITSTTAKSGGSISSDGGGSITDRGVCWSTSENPTTADSKTNDGTGTSDFESTITGILVNSTYYVRAYAINKAGIAYGNQVSYFSGVTDVEGNNYPIVNIGTQCWMQENLKVTKYIDGSSIPYVTDSVTWINISTAAYCWFKNDISNKKTSNGALYKYYTVISNNNLCPSGWHIPSADEWTILTDFLGGPNVAGEKMKSTTGWNSNGNGTNSSGFNGISSGFRSSNAGFFGSGISNSWWSSTGDAFALFSTNKGFQLANQSKNMGFSVRCLRNN